MNAPHPLQPVVGPQAQPADAEDEINLLEYWDIIVDNRWLVGVVTAAAVAVGGAYAFLTKPVYESNLLIQVEDSAGSTKSLLGEAASMFDVKTAATAEIEILRSRMVVSQAVDNTRLYIDASPKYLPVVGEFLARRAKSLSDPGLFGFGGYVSGSESIAVSEFAVPAAFEGQEFEIIAHGGGRYELKHPDLQQSLSGVVGTTATLELAGQGQISITLAALHGKPGAQFSVVRRSRTKTVEALQAGLMISEKGRQSGVIDVSMRSTDPMRLTLVLNEIGRQYVRQNIERRAEEAQKTLAFLDVQLPQFKRQLDQAEEAYNRYRNRQGTVALDEEAKLILSQAVDLQSKLVDAQQRRRELVARFTPQHPAVQTLDAQIGAWNNEIAKLNARVKGLPAIQQDAVRLERDVKVNTALYQELQNNALQLQLVREGKTGNVRLIDTADLPEGAVSPRKPLVLALSLAIGLFGGVMLAIGRNAFFRGIRNPMEIEAGTGLNVYSTIPLSEGELAMKKRASAKSAGLHVLAHVLPDDPAIESLRSLRTAMQFVMLETQNNRLIITGATPGVGKSFVSVNFAAVLAAAGKRVLLIDADLRRGHLNQYFGIPRGVGLSELIAGVASVDHAVHRNLLPQLDIISTGTLPPNPSEMVMSRAFAQVLDQLSPAYDIVIVDTAPVLVAADTLSIALLAGTRLLVARAGETQIGELNESAKRLLHAGASVTGVLFNAMDLTRRHYGSYGYRYGGYRYRQYSYEPSVNS